MKAVDKYNTIVGSIVAILAAILGDYWYLFVAFLALNVLDWLSGWYKARQLKKETSAEGLKGIIKKLGYWCIVATAFIVANVFSKMGEDILHINLDFLLMIGWLTLAMLIVNEVRSILENLVELGYPVPDVLIRGLAVTEKLINSKTYIKDDDKKN